MNGKLRLCLSLPLLGYGLHVHAQCRVVTDPPFGGIGITSVSRGGGDTIRVASVWETHEQDRVLEFRRAARTHRCADLTVLRRDGRVQGIFADKTGAYFFSADSLPDYRARNKSYSVRQLRQIWYLPAAGHTADDESYLMILALHLDAAGPIRAVVTPAPTIQLQVFTQAPTYEDSFRIAETYVREVCGPQKRTERSSSRYCDDGTSFTTVLEFVCASPQR